MQNTTDTSRELFTLETDIFSVLIMTYNNSEYLFSTIDSVLVQDYPYIEIVISDDGSEEFNEGPVRAYIECKKAENIKGIVIHQNEKNMGTVKNANWCLNACKGQYIKFLSAGDEFNSTTVLSYMQQLLKRSKTSVVLSLSGCYDEQLKTLCCYQPTLTEFNKYRKMDSFQMFRKMCLSNCVGATGLFFKAAFFHEYGIFDERYRLTEDWPALLKAFRTGLRMTFDDMISVKYRGGGVSKSKNREIRALLNEDARQMYTAEVLPYIDKLTFADKRTIRYIYEKAAMWETAQAVTKALFIFRYVDVIAIYRLSSTIHFLQRSLNLCSNRHW